MRAAAGCATAVAAIIAVACGGTGDTTSALDGAAAGDTGSPTGSSDAGNDAGGGQGEAGTSPAGPVADAYVSAAVGPLANSAACPLSGMLPFVTIGGPASPKPTTVSDGSAQAGAVVHVSCTVLAAAGGFDVHASASMGAGALTITGHVSATGGQDLSASFTETMFGTYSQTGACTVAYDGNPVPVSPAVAPGRIWGDIQCFNLQNPAATTPSPDGGHSTPATCQGLAYFLFEGCGA